MDMEEGGFSQCSFGVKFGRCERREMKNGRETLVEANWHVLGKLIKESFLKGRNEQKKLFYDTWLPG